MLNKKNSITEVVSLIADTEGQGETGGKVTDLYGRIVTLACPSLGMRQKHQKKD